MVARRKPASLILVNALTEVTGYLAGETVRAVSTPGTSAGRRTPGAAAGLVCSEMPQVDAGTLDAATEVHWQEITRIARGEVAGIAEAEQILSSAPDTALLEFALTRQGTAVFAVAGEPVAVRAERAAAGTWAAPPHTIYWQIAETVTLPVLQELAGHCAAIPGMVRRTEP